MSPEDQESYLQEIGIKDPNVIYEVQSVLGRDKLPQIVSGSMPKTRPELVKRMRALEPVHRQVIAALNLPLSSMSNKERKRLTAYLKENEGLRSKYQQAIDALDQEKRAREKAEMKFKRSIKQGFFAGGRVGWVPLPRKD
jgi:hypothetical protein